MKTIPVLLSFALLSSAATPRSEQFRYQLNWPSGISLGEGQMKAIETEGQWKLELTMEASIPGFQIIDRFNSTLNASLCSVEFERDFIHGSRKSKEKTTFDLTAATAKRQTDGGGGSSEISTSACPHDALGFLFYARRELIAGRVPQLQPVYAGGAYQLRMELLGTQTITIGGVATQADCYRISAKGSASNATFEVLFAKDEFRTPLLVRVPFALGTFTMELIP